MELTLALLQVLPSEPLSSRPRIRCPVCESIIGEGELTYDELYKLAESRSNHREACVR